MIKHTLFPIFLFLLLSVSSIAQCDISSTGIGTLDGTKYDSWNYMNDPGTGALGTYSQENTIKQSGTNSLSVNVLTAHNWGMRFFNRCNITLTQDNYYTIKFWVYGGDGKQIKVALQHASVIDEQTLNLTGQVWKQYEVTIQSNGNYSNGKIKFTFPQVGLFYLDQIELEEIVSGTPKTVKPNNINLRYTGVVYNDITDTYASFYRFPQAYATSDETVAGSKVKTASRASGSGGISIEFKTNSKSIKALFRENTTTTGGLTTLKFAVYKNGQLYNTYADNDDNIEFSFNDLSGAVNTWRITMPSFAQIEFLGLEIDGNTTLMPLPTDDRPVYVAIGNSITHGMGQTQLSTHLTYPWIVADSLNYHLYNWGIGGSKINEGIFANFANSGITPDVVSVLWGYNDFNCTFSPCNTDDYIKNNTMVYYTNLMTNLASTFPNASIVGILPTFSSTPDYTAVRSLGYLRTEQMAVITNLQSTYNNITFFNGNDITDAGSLSDVVHLNDLGAIQVAHALIKELDDFGALEKTNTDTLAMRSEYELVNDLIIDLEDASEGSDFYSIDSGNDNNYYSINASTGELTIANTILDIVGSVHTDILKISIGLNVYNITVVDAYDYFISEHPEFTVLETHQDIVAEAGNEYTPYNNLWGKGTAVNGVDFRMATLVHDDNPDSTIFIWDTPSKAEVFGGSSVWCYQNIFWGERYNLRENIGDFPIRIGDIASLTMDFDYEQLFGTQTYKVALNHFLNYEDYVAPFSENDGDLFVVFDQVGNYIPSYNDVLGDTLIGGYEYIMLHDSTGTIENVEGYQLRRAIIKNDGQYLKGTLDLSALYHSFSSRGYLNPDLHFSHIQFGIEITQGWGAVQINNFKMNLTKNITPGISQNWNAIEGSLYPNPSSERVYLQGVEDSEAYYILNSSGSVVNKGFYSQQGIQVEDLPKGIYLIVKGNQSWKVTVE